MSPQTAKTVVSNIVKADPYRSLSAKLKEVFGNFLEKASPAEVKLLYKEANEAYKPLADLRKVAYPKVGEFNTSNLTRFFSQYVNKGVDSGHSKIIGLLSNGNKIVPANPAFKQAFDELGSVRSEIETLKAQKPTIISDISKASMKASNLIDVIEKNSINPLGKIAKAAARAAFPVTRGFMGAMPMGVLEGEVQKRAVGYDPMEAFQAFMTGSFGNPQQKQQAEQEAIRRYQEASTI